MVTVVSSGVMTRRSRPPALTVMMPLVSVTPRLLLATMRPVPASAGINRPLESIVPIAPKTAQATTPLSVTRLPLWSWPLTLKRTVSSAVIVVSSGAIVSRASCPAVTMMAPVVSATP